jgi:hypothetical protein
MFSTKFRKGAGRAAVMLATTALLATGVAPAHAADSTKVFLSFESADFGKGVSISGQGPFGGPSTSISATTNLMGDSLKFVKSGEPWGGVNLLIATTTAFRYTDADKPMITMDYWSNDTVASPVMLKLTAGDSAVLKAVEAQPGMNSLTFDMSTGLGWDATKEYNIVTVFPNFGADDTSYTGAAAVANTGQIYEIDNVSINGGTITDVISAPPVPRVATSTLLTFEDSDTLGALAAGDASAEKAAGGFEGLSTSIEAAPTGGNGGKALKMVKNQGAQTYAGVNLVKFVADTRVTDGTNKVVTMNYYSAKANSTVRLEVRPYPAALGVDVTATKVGWQRLTFDFTNVAGWSADTEYGDLTLFPDFNVAGANTTYYVDNVAFNGAVTPALPTPVVAVKPAVRVAATVAGTAKVGKTLTAGKGSWTGTATISYTYKWYRCVAKGTVTSKGAPLASAKCSTISGATKSAYKLAKADIGKYVRVLVTAKNSKGSSYSLSKTTSLKVAK